MCTAAGLDCAWLSHSCVVPHHSLSLGSHIPWLPPPPCRCSDYYDISVAVSTPKGLVVPVLRDVDRMSFADVEKVRCACWLRCPALCCSRKWQMRAAWQASGGHVWCSEATRLCRMAGVGSRVSLRPFRLVTQA